MRNSNPILLVEHDYADATTNKAGFRLFRYFQLVSVPAIVIILIVAGLGLRFILRKFVLSEAERDAIRISCGIHNCEMHRFFGENRNKEQSLSIPQEELLELDHQIRAFLTPFDIVNIKVYNTNTKIVYSTDPKIIGRLDPDNANLTKALRGSVVSKYETKEHVWDLAAEERFDVEIVETYVPVRGSDGRIIGSFEIYKDVTKDLVIADRTLIRAGVMLSTTVLSVFATLMFVIRRAEKLKSINQQLLSEITKRKWAEQRLKKTAEEWASTFNSITDSVSIQDKDFKFVRVNKAFADAFEMKPEEVTGKTCYELVHGAKEPWPTCPHKDALDTKKPQRAEFFEPRLGVYLEVSVSPIFDEDGEMVGSVHIAKNITERKKAEQAIQTLTESIAGTTGQEAFDKIVTNLCKWLDVEFAIVGQIVKEEQVNVLSMYSEGEIIHDYSYSLAGTPCDYVIQKGYCVYPENVHRQFPEDKELVELKAEGYVGIPLRDRKGGAIGVLCAISRQKLNLPKETEQIMRILATKASYEIERKKSEETARESEKRFHTSVENMLDCFGIYTAIRNESGRIVDFRIEYVNAAACANNFMTKDEQIGKRLCELLPAHRKTGLFDEYCQVVETGRPLRKESLIYEDVYGSKQFKRAFGISAVKLGDGFTVAWRDITERKKAEEKQVELLEKVDNINKELKEFASIVSHDLKAPLRGIKTLAGWILSDCGDKLDDQANEQMNLLLERVERMYNLIEGALQYSRAGRAEGKRVQVNLNNFVPEIIDMVVPPENITVTIENELPVIECEETHVMQVFQNLLSNAIKYMDKPQGWIKVGCVEQDGFWKFSVADNGPGIEEKHFENIFKIFQALPTSPDFQGTGVGLTVAKKIVELYDGKIWVESKVGEGSTFFFTMPKSGALQEVSTGATSENIKYSN